MTEELLLLVDGNALLYRAYHAFPKELTTPSGEIIGAVYGFSRILLSTIKTLKPTSVAVCFDLKGPTFRHLAYDKYKGTRQKMPDDLATQISRVHEIVEKFEFPIYTAESFEADDVIGTLANQATLQNPTIRVVILTGDQDIIQLVTDRIQVYSPVTSSKQPILYTIGAVEAKYGFSPRQMIDYKALRGDPSDNIPGVPGIGEVTAKKLLQEFSTVDAVYEHIDSPSIKASVKTKLVEHKESAFLSKELATIVTNAPVTFDPAACKMQLQNPEKLITLFQELGFKSLLRDLPTSHRLLSEATDVFGSEAVEEPEIPASESAETDKQIAPILRKMETYGVKVDCAYLKELETEFVRELETMRKQLYDFAGQEFNPDSPSQVGTILYEVLSIPTQNIRKGKTGYTTDATTLQELAKQFPIAALLLQYRELTKLLNTYVKPLQELVDEHSRVHTSYAPDTSSGRISSRNPNLQNIPVRSEQGKRLRHAFVADVGKILIAADYSQIELRLAAHLSGDPVMQEAFLNGEDFHTETGLKMGVDRRMAKIINFSILYGKGSFGFAMDMGISVAEAKQYIENYFKTYAKLREYLDSILVTARQQGYTETLYGRRRYFPDLTSSNFQRRSASEREAVNMPIQGSAADILKMAMLELDTQLQKEFPEAQMILTVHDELVIEAPKDQYESIANLLHKTMTTAVEISVPLEVSLKYGSNWGEMNVISL